MTWPHWITEIRSARENRNRMSCSIIDDGHASAQAFDQRRQLTGTLGAHAGGRFVEEEQPRLCRERNGDLQPSTVAIGEVARQRMLPARESHVCQQRHGPRVQFGVTPYGTERPERATSQCPASRR